MLTTGAHPVTVAPLFVGVISLLKLWILEIHSFPHFSPTCFDILSRNCAYAFVILYYRSCSSVVNLHQCLYESFPFLNLEYWKYTVFCTFLLFFPFKSSDTSGVKIANIKHFYVTTAEFSHQVISLVWS